MTNHGVGRCKSVRHFSYDVTKQASIDGRVDMGKIICRFACAVTFYMIVERFIF